LVVPTKLNIFFKSFFQKEFLTTHLVKLLMNISRTTW